MGFASIAKPAKHRIIRPLVPRCSGANASGASRPLIRQQANIEALFESRLEREAAIVGELKRHQMQI